MIPSASATPWSSGSSASSRWGWLLTAALRADDLPLIGGGDTYRAAFTESGGLKQGDEVRIAGVRVGKVDEVALDDGLVVATFKVDPDEAFGPDTRAAIKVKTLLGAMYLALEPAGGGQLEEELDHPGRAHLLAVRRRGRLRGPGRHHRQRSTPTSSPAR